MAKKKSKYAKYKISIYVQFYENIEIKKKKDTNRHKKEKKILFNNLLWKGNAQKNGMLFHLQTDFFFSVVLLFRTIIISFIIW